MIEPLIIWRVGKHLALIGPIKDTTSFCWLHYAAFCCSFLVMFGFYKGFVKERRLGFVGMSLWRSLLESFILNSVLAQLVL